MEERAYYASRCDRPASCLRARWPQQLALTALFGLCLLPFLVPLRTLPISSFYAEWLALGLGVLALPALAGGGKGIVVPRIALLPAGLALLLVLQYLWLPSALRPATLIALLYLVWAALLMLLTAALLRDMPLSRLAGYLALALVLAAVINACNVILFQAGLRTGPDWWFMRTDRAGNLGQSNMLADLLWIGVVSVLYRWQTSQRRGWLHVLWLPPLLVASALTGARAPMLYALWLMLAAAILGDRRLRRAAICVALFYCAIVALVHWLPVPITNGSDSVTRMLQGSAGPMLASANFSSSGNIRLDLMSMAGLIFRDHLWLGAGWSSFAWESYSRAGTLVDAQAAAEHAHQLFFQLAAELGVAAPVWVLGALLLWAWPIWQARVRLSASREYWWAVSAAGIVLLHSQLEYPLWYAHLLGVLAILLVCAEQRSFVFAGRRCSRLTVAALMASGVYLLAGSMYDYIRLQDWLVRDVQRGNVHAPAGHYQLLADLSRDSLLQASAVRVLAAVMPPTREQLEAKRAVCRRALLSEPQAPAVFTCALLEGLAGETARAELNMRQAKRVFANELPPYVRRLGAVLTPAQLAEHQHLLALAPESAVTPTGAELPATEKR